MKSTHRDDIYTFSTFDEKRNVDFNGYLLVRPEGNVMIDPVPLIPHDMQHVRELGGVRFVLVTNSDHVRATSTLAAMFEAEVVGPVAERERFPVECTTWVGDGDAWLPGLELYALRGSKTPGELAVVVDQQTLITGDLVRGQRGGALNLLPDPKLSDRAAAVDSVRRLASRESITAVLVGDGWPVFADGHRHLCALVDALNAQ